jgi:hypothetical protein
VDGGGERAPWASLGEGDGIGGVLGSGGAPKAGLDHDLQLQAAA